MEDRAVEECNANLGGMTMLAALSSSAGEVREVGDQVETIPGWADHLPVDSKNYAAICIYDASEVKGIKGDPDYIAFWVSADDSVGGSSIITVWTQTPD